jgi:hypothetical protein
MKLNDSWIICITRLMMALAIVLLSLAMLAYDIDARRSAIVWHITELQTI